MITAWVVGLGRPFEWSGKTPLIGEVLSFSDGRRGTVMAVNWGFYEGRNPEGQVRRHLAKIDLAPVV